MKAEGSPAIKQQPIATPFPATEWEDMYGNRTSPLVPENYLSSRSSAAVIAEATLLVITNFLSLFGNCLVCGAIYRSPVLQTETNLLLVALAVSDILMAVIAMPFSEAALVAGQWPFGEIACQIQGYFIAMLAFLSLQLMTLTAVNRYMKVVRPNKYKKVFTKRKTLLMILFICFIAASVIAVLLFARTDECYFTFHTGKAFCVPKFTSIQFSRTFTATYGLMFVVFPALIISTCYVKILRTIKRQRREYSACRGLYDSKSILEREENKLTRIVLAIILGFAACWIPCMVIDFVDISVVGFLPREVYLTYTFLGFGSSLINPILYGIMNKLVRREAYNLIACKCKKRTESGRNTWSPATSATCANFTIDRGSRETLKLSGSNRNIYVLELGELQSELAAKENICLNGNALKR